MDTALGNKNELLSEMGTFDAEKIPLKKMARQGQLFSGTKAITTLDPTPGYEIEDILDIEIEQQVEGETVKYCFTDGIGNISGDLASLINEKYGLSQCSAYQIRMGGVKGVLMYDNKLKGRKVQIRPSQKKFASPDTQLEVIRCATYSQGYLNRQVIMLMSC